MSRKSKQALAEERLAACKGYMRVDYDEDDALIISLMAMADEYLTGAGCVRELRPASYDLVLHAIVLSLYDGRGEDAAGAAQTVPSIARHAMNQLKILCGYGGEPDGGQDG